MTTSLKLTSAGSSEPAVLTPAMLATLGGMATAVLIVVDSVHAATGWTSPWFALTLAIALAFVVEFALGQAGASRPRAVRVALALVNGCLVFTTALGGNQVASRAASVTAAQPQISIRASSAAPPAPDGPFFHDWLR
jgi:hypothetical protein